MQGLDHIGWPEGCAVGLPELELDEHRKIENPVSLEIGLLCLSHPTILINHNQNCHLKCQTYQMPNFLLTAI